MHKLEVGKLYHSNATIEREGPEYNFRNGQHELLVRLKYLTPVELADYRQGRAEFALYAADGLVILCYRFGQSQWSDAPYSWHLVPPAQQSLPAPLATPETRALLSVILVDAATGIVQALRVTTFSPDFTRALHAAITAQAASPWDAPEYDRKLTALYARHSSGQLAQRAQVRCVGGADDSGAAQPPAQPIDLDDTLLSQEASSTWQRLAAQAAARCQGQGVTLEEIGYEQAEVNADGSLTIFVAARGQRVCELRLEPAHWSRTKPAPAQAVSISYGDVLARLESSQSALWRQCYPRLYQSAGAYGSPKVPAVAAAVVAEWVRDTGFQQTPQTVKHIYQAVSAARSYDFPLLFVAPDLLAAIAETEAPAQTDWRTLRLPYPAGALMLPAGALRHPTDGAVDFLGWARIEANQPHSFGPGWLEVRAGQDIFIIWTALREAVNLPLLDTVLNASTSPHIGDATTPGTATQASRAGVFDLPLAAGEQEFLAQCRQLVFGVMMALESRPRLVDSPGRRVGKHQKSRREIWTPTIIGKGYRIVRERHAPTGGTHAAPRLHWRRGHYRNQAFGPGRSERKLIWIEPALIGAGE